MNWVQLSDIRQVIHSFTTDDGEVWMQMESLSWLRVAHFSRLLMNPLKLPHEGAHMQRGRHHRVLKACSSIALRVQRLAPAQQHTHTHTHSSRQRWEEKWKYNPNYPWAPEPRVCKVSQNVCDRREQVEGDMWHFCDINLKLKSVIFSSFFKATIMSICMQRGAAVNTEVGDARCSDQGCQVPPSGWHYHCCLTSSLHCGLNITAHITWLVTQSTDLLLKDPLQHTRWILINRSMHCYIEMFRYNEFVLYYN